MYTRKLALVAALLATPAAYAQMGTEQQMMNPMAMMGPMMQPMGMMGPMMGGMMQPMMAPMGQMAAPMGQMMQPMNMMGPMMAPMGQMMAPMMPPTAAGTPDAANAPAGHTSPAK